MLTKARFARTEVEVEQEFKERQRQLSLGGSPDSDKIYSKKKVDPKLIQDDMFSLREKSKLLLLPSQVEIMREVFDICDKYKDFILKRKEFVIALRTDDLVVDFVDVDAVQCADPKKTILTLD